MSSYLYGNYINEMNSIDRNNTKSIVESINSICKSTICSLSPIDEEYIVVNEIYFSKKDLQDPETLKKLLKKAEKEKDIKEKLDILFYALTFIEAVFGTVVVSKAAKAVNVGSGMNGGLSIFDGGFVFIGLLVVFVKLTSTVVKALDKALLYIHKSRIDKLKKKAIELRDKNKNTNPQVAANCQKLIDTIDQYCKDVEDAKFKKVVDKVENEYDFLVKLVHGEDYIEDISDGALAYWIAEKIGISFDAIDKGQIKYGMNKSKYWCKEIYPFNNNDLDNMDEAELKDAEILKKYMPEFNEPDKSTILLYFYIDDTLFMYSPKGKVFYYGGGSDYTDKDFSKSIEPYTKGLKYYSFEKKEEETYFEALKVADIELGYYRLSKPPKSTTPKKI